MSLDQWAALATIATPVVAFLGLFQVARQMHESTHQQVIANEQEKTNAILKYYDINRELIILGFATPELFHVLSGKKTDSDIERRYLQLWINQFAVVHRFQQQEVFPPDELEGLKRDIRTSMTQTNMQQHWKNYRQYYTADFQKFIDGLVPSEEKKANAPEERPPQE